MSDTDDKAINNEASSPKDDVVQSAMESLLPTPATLTSKQDAKDKVTKGEWPSGHRSTLVFMVFITINVSIAVDILLNPTGNVPIMKTKKWAVDQEKPISWVIKFIHKYLKLDAEDKLVSAMDIITTMT